MATIFEFLKALIFMKSRVNIVVDQSLLDEALKCARTVSKNELVNVALREFVRHHKRADIRELRGKGMIDPSYAAKFSRRIVRSRSKQATKR
jgi:Arc/MetJ family transcription regulator